MESNTKKAIKVVPLLIALVFMLIALVLVVLEGLGLVEVGIFYKRALEKENTVELSISAPLTDGTFIRLNGRLIYKTRTDLGSREFVIASSRPNSLHSRKTLPMEVSDPTVQPTRIGSQFFFRSSTLV